MNFTCIILFVKICISKQDKKVEEGGEIFLHIENDKYSQI